MIYTLLLLLSLSASSHFVSVNQPHPITKGLHGIELPVCHVGLRAPCGPYPGGR